MVRQNKKEQHRINIKISQWGKITEVRIIGDIEEIEKGIYTLEEAISLADEYGVDLVEISPNAKPPVCKLVDYNKFLYEIKKKQKDIEQKQKENQMGLKEVRFGPNTDNHDFQFKLNHIRNFLQKNNKVKAYVFFKGREITFKEKGEILLLRLASELENDSIVEMMPKLVGRRMTMIFKPKK